MTQNKAQHIAIAGNIGAGKTTLVRSLSQYFGWREQLESVDDNPYLEDFYLDMKKWAFPLQIFFLHSRFNQMMKIRESVLPIIQDRTIYEDAYIFAKNLHQSGYMSSRDYQNYFSLFQSMTSMVQAPDLLIYLRADIDTLVKQIKRRGRDYEANISIAYLESLNEHYESWITHYTEGKLLVLDVNELDYVTRPDDLAYVLQKVKLTLDKSEVPKIVS